MRKNFLITGASRGIGKATALLLSQRERCSLTLLGRDSAALRTTLREVTDLGSEAKLLICDLQHTDALERAVQRHASEAGAPDVIIHNAAVIHRLPFEQMTAELWEEQLKVNLLAPAVITRALVGQMRKLERGRVLFVGSISSTLGTARSTAYNASKWALVGFMKSLAEEFKNSGLMTAAILPGSVDTEMLHGSGFEPRMTALDVAQTLAYYALDAPIAHNGGIIEMFGT